MEAVQINTQTGTGPMDFKSYLEQSLRNPFTIDLSGADVMTVIRTCIRIRSKASPNYGKNLACLISTLQGLQKTFCVTLQPLQITDIFWQFFVGYLHDKGFKPTSITTLSNQLRSVLRWGSRYNVTLAPSFDVVRIPKAQSVQIALSADDVSHIYHFDVNLFYKDRRPQFRRRMEQVRDMFVLSCNLYQRHSDMVRIEKGCFERNSFRIAQQKTSSFAVVDIDRQTIDPKMTYAILEKYGYEAPFKGDISNLDKYLKQLMRDIGLSEPVRIEQKVNGKIEVRSVPRYELISSHSARRTAITLAVQRGMTMHQVKKCSGHQSLDMVKRYIKD